MTGKINLISISKLRAFKENQPLDFAYWLFRSLLAFSTLLLFILNYNTMKDIYNYGENPFKLFFIKYDIFSILGFNLGYWVSLFFLSLVIIGFLPCFSAIMHFYVQTSYILHYPSMSDGGDYIVTIITFLFLFPLITDFRLSFIHSLPNFKFYQIYQKQSLLINFYAIRLFICIVYFHATVSKFHVVEWYNGTALYYFINDPLSGNANLIEIPFFKYILSNHILITLFSWGTLLTEALIAFMLFSENYKLRKFVFFLGCFLHLCIIPLFYIPMFSFRMISCLYFYLLINNKPTITETQH
jgi:antimicrobial peptide system SdpB family protein